MSDKRETGHYWVRWEENGPWDVAHLAGGWAANLQSWQGELTSREGNAVEEADVHEWGPRIPSPDLNEPEAVSSGEHERVVAELVAELERVRTQPKAPTHDAVKRGFYNGRSGWARHFGLACEDLDNLDYWVSDLVTVSLETRNLMRRELACVRTHMIDAYDEVTTGVTETERRLWGARQNRPLYAATMERVVMRHLRRKLTASDSEEAKRCLICGHEPCPHCGDWCDSIITDPDGEMILCCSGGCTYTDEELQRYLVENPKGFVEAVRDSGTYAWAVEEEQAQADRLADQKSARIDDMLGEAVTIAEVGDVPGPETIKAWRDEIEDDDQDDDHQDDDDQDETP